MTPVDPARIMSRSAVVQRELQTSATWKAALDKASMAPTPLLVRSIAATLRPQAERPSRLPDYYIVSFLLEGGISARFAHNAETADLLEAEGISKAGAVLKPYVDAVPVIRSRWPNAVPGTSGDVVWQPCRQSTSRFAPFWRFQIEGQTVYVRADGMLFTELTTTGRG